MKKLKAVADAVTATTESELQEDSQVTSSPTEIDQEDGAGSDDSDDGKVLKRKLGTKPKTTKFQEDDIDRPPKYSTTGGLYGNTAMPTTMPQMSTKLGGQTYEEYVEWKPKAKTYCEINSISEVTLESPINSWKKAIKADAGTHSMIQLLNMWHNLHKKASAVLRAATESALGLSFFNDIEQEQEAVTEFDLYSIDPDEPESFACFIQHNANHLWVKIKEKCGRITPQHIGGLMKRYTSLQYKITQRPEEFRKEFEKIVNELEQNGCSLPELAHMAIWFNALPPELDSLKQGLNARSKLTWQGVFDALQSQYIKKPSGKLPSGESAKALQEKEEALAHVRCYGCNQFGHIRPHCPNKDPSNRGGRGNGIRGRGGRFRGRGGRGRSDSKRSSHDNNDQEFDESSFQYVMPLIDEEIIAAARERGQPLDSAESVVFVFDSAATSHVTPHEHIIKNLESVPSVTMTSALKGATVTVNKRGTVQLTSEWILKDVALLPRASVSLISEGRIADAGFTIIKTKDDIKIIPPNKNKPLFTGKRVDKLWIITVGGPNPKKRSIAPFARVRQSDDDDDDEKEGVGAGAVTTSSSSSTSSQPYPTGSSAIRGNSNSRKVSRKG